MKTKEYAKQFLTRVEEYLIPHSDPKLTRQILEAVGLKNLKTDTTEYNNFILKITQEEIDLSALITHLKETILNNEPLCSLLAYIEEHHLIADAELKQFAPTLKTQLHLLFIFEATLITMANGERFALDIYNHFTQRNPMTFPGNPIADFFFAAPYNASLFERLKLLSVKPGLTNIIFHRAMGEHPESQADVDQFVSEKGLSGWNANIQPTTLEAKTTETIPSMGVNILEAMWEDFGGHAKHQGGIENAYAGAGLIALMECKQYTTSMKLVSHVLPERVVGNQLAAYSLLPDLKLCNSKKKVSEFHIDKNWQDLYTSWNALFVMGNIEQIFMPVKLFLPSVISAHPQNYKETRVMSLFLFGSILLRESPRTNPLFLNLHTLQQAPEIFKAWGHINKDYASKLLHEMTPDPQFSQEIEAIFQEILGDYPNLNFARQLLAFVNNPLNHRFTKTYSASQTMRGNPLFFAFNAPKASASNNIMTMEPQPYSPGLSIN